MQRQLAVNFELVGGRHAFAGVEQHVGELSTQQRKTVNISHKRAAGRDEPQVRYEPGRTSSAAGLSWSACIGNLPV